MTVTEVKENKKKYLDLLLLADEEEKMIDKYLDRGVMYLMEKDLFLPLSMCMVTGHREKLPQEYRQEVIFLQRKGMCV